MYPQLNSQSHRPREAFPRAQPSAQANTGVAAFGQSFGQRYSVDDFSFSDHSRFPTSDIRSTLPDPVLDGPSFSELDARASNSALYPYVLMPLIPRVEGGPVVYRPIDFSVVGRGCAGVRMSDVQSGLQQVQDSDEILFAAPGYRYVQHVHVTLEFPGYDIPYRRNIRLDKYTITRGFLIKEILDLIKQYFDFLKTMPFHGADDRWRISSANRQLAPQNVILTRLIHVGKDVWTPEIWIPA